jgi:hypothetical protein
MISIPYLLKTSRKKIEKYHAALRVPGNQRGTGR